MATYSATARQSMTDRKNRIAVKAARFACAFYWLLLCSAATKTKRALPVPIRITLRKEESGPCHGSAIVYDTLSHKEKIAADIFHPAWFLMQPLSERTFTINRPELLCKASAKTLKAIVRQFELQGLGVKELHLNAAGCTVVHFVN